MLIYSSVFVLLSFASIVSAIYVAWTPTVATNPPTLAYTNESYQGHPIGRYKHWAVKISDSKFVFGGGQNCQWSTSFELSELWTADFTNPDVIQLNQNWPESDINAVRSLRVVLPSLFLTYFNRFNVFASSAIPSAQQCCGV
jgi:hypothetical protein